MPTSPHQRRRPQPSHGAHGFTLVEVLVALSIMAIIAMMAWQGVDGIVRTRAASNERLEQTLRLNTVLAQWERDLQAVASPETLPEGMPAMQFDGISVRMVRRTPEGMQVVAWSLRGGQLLRWASPRITTSTALKGNWDASGQLLGNEPSQLRTLTGVSEWQFYCYRQNAWSNCQSSAGTAQTAPVGTSAPTRDPKPDGLRLVMSFASGSGFAGFVTRDIAIN